ncbi:MAG: ABC transporter substrate-binding protein [Planctomycetaceae bacterium]
MTFCQRLFLFLILAMCAGFGCAERAPENRSGTQVENDSKAPLRKVQLALNWYPEAEHGGFYAARIHGYYAEAGLDVEILPGGPNTPTLQRVANGSVDFGIENADRILMGRAAEADVVAVMAPIQTSPRCIMVHRSSGIQSFDQLKNIRLAIGSGAAWAEFFKKNVPLEGVELVPYSGNVSQFLLDEKFAQQAYIFSEPFLAEKEKGDPHTLMVSDLGYNPYTSVMIAGGESVREKPDLVRKMVGATVRGWKKYLEQPDETNAHIAGLNPQMGRDVLDYGVKALKPLCITKETPIDSIGTMSPERWEKLAKQLEEVGAIKPGSVDPKAAFSTEFLSPGK